MTTATGPPAGRGPVVFILTVINVSLWRIYTKPSFYVEYLLFYIPSIFNFDYYVDSNIFDYYVDSNISVGRGPSELSQLSGVRV